MVCAAMAVVLWARGAAAGTVAQPAKFLHRYGYDEARFRLQKMPGWWSAFWMLTETPSPRRGRGVAGGADAFEACAGTKTGDQEIFYPKNGSLNFV